jgi:uncharacterized protein
MTVVIDCNILVMCLTTRSPFHTIYKQLVAGSFHLAVTTDIVLEYQEIIQQKYGVSTADAFIARCFTQTRFSDCVSYEQA